MKTGVVAALGGIALFYAGKFVHRRLKRHQLRTEALAFLRKAHPELPALPEVSPEKAQLILSSSATQLAALIKERKVTSVEAVTVYILQAYREGRRLHLSAEESFAVALTEAAACDEQLATNPEHCGRLHGVPICIKDVFAERGKAATCGVARLTTSLCEEDAVAVQVLKSHGAIVFLRGSVPQAVEWVETDNHIFGRGENPRSSDRATGGCAEAGLVASLSAPLGLTTDARDSMQLGCAFTGAYGVRLTPERVSRVGVKHSHSTGVSPYEWIMNTSVGVVGRSAEDLTTLCQLLWTADMFRKDMTVPELPFNDQTHKESRQLTIGVCVSNGLIDPIPGAKTRLEAISQKLREMGYKVVEFKPPAVSDMISQANNAVHSYLAKAIDESLQGEEDIAAHAGFKAFYGMRRYHRTCKLLLKMTGEKRLAEHLKYPLLQTSAQTISVYYVVRDYRIAFVKAWQAAGLDLLLCPTWPLPAPRHGEVQNVMMALSYTTLWNLMGFPVGVAPTGPLTKDEIKYESPEIDSLTQGCKKICEGAEGLPFAVSVVGMPYTDERVLGFLQEMENAGINMDAQEVAHSEKVAGNEHFRQGQLEEACKCYSKALLAVNQVFRTATDDAPLKELAQEVQIPCLLNLALCYLKLGVDLQNAVTHCSSVLQIDNSNVKAYYRRAQAYLQMQEFTQARSDLISALNLDPGNSSLKECWQELQQKQQLYNDKSKRMAKAAFREEPKPSLSREILWGVFRCCRRKVHEATLRR